MAGLHIPITATDNNVSSKLDQVSRKIDELASRAQASNNTMIDSNSKLGASFGALASKVGASVAAIASVQKLNEIRQTITQVRGEFEQLEISLTTILGSKAEADKLMAQVVDFAAKTPFDMKGVASGVKQLLAYGSSADSVIDEMRMLGDIASGLSIPLEDMVYLFGTTRTQGRMFTQDLRQFMGRGIPLAEELAKQFGVTKAEVGNLVTDGKVGFNEMYKALQAMTSEGGKFYNLMDAQSRSILGMQSNAEDARDQMHNEIGKLLEGVTAKGIEAQNLLYENYEKVGAALFSLVSAYGVYKAVLITVNALHKVQKVVLKEAVLQKKLAAMANVTLSNSEAVAAARTALLNKSMKGLLISLKATGKAMLTNPYVLGAAAVAGLAYGIYKLITAKSAEERATDALNKRLDEYNQKANDRSNLANELISTMRDENKSTRERVESLRNLTKTYPELLDKYSEEELKLIKIAELKRLISNIEATRKKSDIEADIKLTESALKQADNDAEMMTDKQRKVFSDLGFHMRHSGEFFYYSRGAIDAVTKALNEYKKELAKINELEEEERFQSKPLAEKLQIYTERAEAARKKVQELNAEIDKLNGNKPVNGPLLDGGGQYTPPTFSSILGGDTIIAERDAAIKAAENAEKNAEAVRKQQEEAKKKATEDALKEYTKAQTSVDNKLLKSANDSAKRAIQYKIDQSNNYTKNEEQKEYELHMARLEMIEEEKRQALAALDIEYEKYKAIYIAAGKDTSPLDEAFNKLKDNTTTSFNDKSENENADYDKRQKARQDKKIEDEIAYNEKYGSIMEKRAAIEQKYQRLIEKAENEFQKKALGKEKEEALKQFNSDAILEYYLMFIDTSKATIWQIDRAISHVENKIKDLLKKGADSSTEELQNLREQLEVLQDIKLGGIAPNSELSALSTYWAYLDRVIKKREELELLKRISPYDTNEIALVTQQLHDMNESLSELKIETTLSTLSYSLDMVGESLKKIGEADGSKTLSAIGGTLSYLSGAFDAFAKGYETGGIEGGAYNLALYNIQAGVANITNEIASAASEADEINDSIAQFKNNVELLAYQFDESKYDSIFGTNSLNKAIEAYDLAQKSLEKFKESEEKLKGIGVDYKAGGTFKKDNYSTLLELSEKEGWNIWDENGEFDLQAAKLLLETHKGLDQDEKDALTNAIEYKEAYESAMAVVEQVGSEVFGNLASEFADGIINAVEQGEDAFESFGKSSGEVIKTLGKMFLESMLYDKIFDAYSDKIKEAIGTGNAEKLTNLTGQMLDDMKNIYPELYDWYNNLIEQAKAQGIDMDAVAEQEATAKGFQAMSQETGDELNGRFTDIQAKSGMIAIGVNSLVQINTSIFQNTSAMLLQLGEMFGIQNLQLKELNTIAKNTEHLITISEEISALRRNVGVINGD